MRGGDLFRAVRRGRRLSQRELAERAGVPRTTIERIESGATPSPRLEVVSRVLEATGYFLVLIDHRGRPLLVRPGGQEALDRAYRCFPAHQPIRPVTREGDGWWGWRRIAWLPEDPKVPEFASRRIRAEYRLPRTSTRESGPDDWGDAT